MEVIEYSLMPFMKPKPSLYGVGYVYPSWLGWVGIHQGTPWSK